MKKLKLMLLAVSMLLVLSGCGYTNPHTPAGHEGYIYEDPMIFGNGGYQGTVNGPGNFGVSPWNNKAINVDMRPNTYPEGFKILANDDLNVSVGFHAVLELEEDSVKDVVENYGGDKWYGRYVRKSFRTFIRESVQGYDSKKIRKNRTKIGEDVKKKLAVYLEGSPIIIKSLVVGNIDYPEAVERAVEEKLAAKQRLEAKETEREIAVKDAEIKVAEATGIAEAQKIINTTLTANYLQHEAIQAQLKMASSPNHTTVYIPSGANGIPLIKQIK